MHVETPGVSPERGGFMAHTPQPATQWIGSPLGSLSHSCFPQFMGDGSKLLVPFRVLFKGDLVPDCGSAANACCNPAIWWTFLQAPEIRAAWISFDVLMNHLEDVVKMQIRIQWIWGGIGDSTSLTCSQVMSMLLLCRPHFEQQQVLEGLGPGLRDWRKRQGSNACVEVPAGISNPVWSLQC